MSDNDHPFVAAAKKYSDGGSDVSHEDFTNSRVKDFVSLHPDTRRQILSELDGLIGADDGTSLEQRSQLLSLNRALAHTHGAMRKVNR